MCSKEELLRQLMEEASVLTDEEVEEVLEYARREFEEAVEEGKWEKRKAQQSDLLGLPYGLFARNQLNFYPINRDSCSFR